MTRSPNRPAIRTAPSTACSPARSAASTRSASPCSSERGARRTDPGAPGRRHCTRSQGSPVTSVPFHPIAGGPCATLAEAAVHARRPFTSSIVQARIWTQTDEHADAVFYVDVRAVVDRLNVLLPGRWRAACELIDQRPAAVEGG